MQFLGEGHCNIDQLYVAYFCPLIEINLTGLCTDFVATPSEHNVTGWRNQLNSTIKNDVEIGLSHQNPAQNKDIKSLQKPFVEKMHAAAEAL